jgi:hypothetical protein
MRETVFKPRESLLMLSHCTPDPAGDGDRARAWQLLELAHQSHGVHLLCLWDGPVSLRQWNAIDDLAERIEIAWPGVPLASLRRWLGAARTRRIDAMGRCVRRTLSEWSADTRFDTVLCTHADLWPAARATAARRHVGDFAQRPVEVRGVEALWPEPVAGTPVVLAQAA